MRIRLVAAIACLLLPGAQAAPSSMPQPIWTAADFWARSGTDGATNESVVGAETVMGAAAWNVTTDRGASGVDATWYRQSDLAKLQVRNGGGTPSETTYTLAAPCPEWQFPFTVGKTWATDCTFTPSDGSAPLHVVSNWTVLRGESVTVPAGTFDAFVLEQAGTDFTERWWFAPAACHWVKHESAGALGVVTSTEALASYHCASAAPAIPTPSPSPSPSPSPTRPTSPSPSPTPSPSVSASASPSPSPQPSPSSSPTPTRAPGVGGAGVALALALAFALARKRS